MRGWTWLGSSGIANQNTWVPLLRETESCAPQPPPCPESPAPPGVGGRLWAGKEGCHLWGLWTKTASIQSLPISIMRTVGLACHPNPNLKCSVVMSQERLLWQGETNLNKYKFIFWQKNKIKINIVECELARWKDMFCTNCRCLTSL